MSHLALLDLPRVLLARDLLELGDYLDPDPARARVGLPDPNPGMVLERRFEIVHLFRHDLRLRHEITLAQNHSMDCVSAGYTCRV